MILRPGQNLSGGMLPVLARGDGAHRAAFIVYLLVLVVLVVAVTFVWAPWIRNLLLLPVWALAPGHAAITFLSGQAARNLPRCMVLSAALSPLVVFVWLYGATTLLELPLEQSLIAGAFILAIVSAVTVVRNPHHEWTAETAYDAKVLVILVLCVTAASLPLLNPIRQLSAHGLWDGAIIMQILAGTIPPDNPALAGHPTNYYWGYHLYLAAWTSITTSSFMEASAVSRLASLVTYTALAYFIAKRFLTPRLASSAALFVGFSLNCQAGAVFLVRLLSGIPVPENFDHFWIIVTSSPDMEVWLGSIFATFMSGGGGSHGRLFWMLVFYACIANGDRRKPHYPLLGAALLGQLFFHHAMAVAVLIAVPIAVGASILFEKRGVWAETLREGGKAAAAFGIPVVVAGPYIWSIASEFGAYGEMAIGVSVRDLGNALIPHIVPLTLFLPFLVFFRRTRRHVFLATLIGVLLSAGLFVDVLELKPKILIPLALPLAIAACLGVEAFAARMPRIRPQTVMACLSALAYASILVWGVGWWMGDRNWVNSPPTPVGEDLLSVHQTTVAADGLSISFDRLPNLMKPMHWIRDNTEPSAVIVERRSYYDRSLVGAVARRRAFVLEALKMIEGLPEGERRFAMIEDLFTPGTGKLAVVDELAEIIENPIYVFLSADRNEADFPALVRELRRTAALTQVYGDAGSVVFKVKR